MIRYLPTTFDARFKSITVSVKALDALMCADDRLPWWVQAFYQERYCDRFSEVSVDEIAQRPVVRLSMDDERAAGRSPITVEDGVETLAVFRDLGFEQIEIEVPWEQAVQIEARLS